MKKVTAYITNGKHKMAIEIDKSLVKKMEAAISKGPQKPKRPYAKRDKEYKPNLDVLIPNAIKSATDSSSPFYNAGLTEMHRVYERQPRRISSTKISPIKKKFKYD